MTAYDPAEWSACSSPQRALETLAMLLMVLLISILGLMPAQGHLAIGGEVLAVSLVVAVLMLRLPTGRARGESEPRGWLAARRGSRANAILPPLIGSLGLIAETGGGLYWVAVGFVFAISAAVANACVLLVEILR